MAKFTIGEIAIITKATGEFSYYKGEECEILSTPFIKDGRITYTIGTNCKIPEPYTEVHAPEDCLKKKRPPQKFEKGNWKDCIWKPKGVYND